MHFVITWVVLAAFWAGLSGHFHGAPLVMGLVSVTLVSLLTWRFFREDRPILRRIAALVRLAAYSPWLLWRIWKANIDVLLRVFGLRSVDPHMYSMCPDLKSDFAKVAFANSVTLTPGTVTVEIRKGEFIIHAISRDAADPEAAEAMERHVRWVEGRGP